MSYAELKIDTSEDKAALSKKLYGLKAVFKSFELKLKSLYRHKDNSFG